MVTVSEFFLAYYDDAQEWCRGKLFHWRAVLLLYFGYAGVLSILNPEYNSFFAGITFGIHELGHVIFSAFGEFISVAGGSFCQVAAPILTMVLFVPQREYFGVAIGGGWLSTSLASLATYVGDARAQNLELVGLTDDPLHDWHYLLSTCGLLAFDTKLAFLIRVLAFVILLASMAWGGWLCWLMFQSKSEPTDYEP